MTNIAARVEINLPIVARFFTELQALPFRVGWLTTVKKRLINEECSEYGWLYHEEANGEEQP